MIKKICLTAIFSLLLMSCNKDEKNINKVSENDIIGKWNISKVYSENTKVIAQTKITPINADVSITSKDVDNASSTFLKSPKKVSHDGTFTLVTKITAFGQEKEKVDVVVLDPTLKENWSLSDKFISFSMQNQVIPKDIKAEILEIDATKLKIKIIISDDYKLPADLKIKSPLGGSIAVTSAKIEGTIYIEYTK